MYRLISKLISTFLMWAIYQEGYIAPQPREKEVSLPEVEASSTKSLFL